MTTKAVPERHVKIFKNGRNQAVRIPREFELPFAGIPQFVSRVFQRPSEPSNGNSGERSNKSGDKHAIEKILTDFPERYIDYIVKSAIVLCAFGCLFAYIYVDRMNRQNSHKQKRKPDNYQNDESTRR